MISRLKFLPIIAAFSLWGILHAEELHLAIVSDQKTRGLADLLTLQLSADPQIALLERDQIDRVLSEQKLSLGGLNLQNTLKAGRFLKAEGIVTLALSEQDNKQTLHCRLIATGPGVLIWSRLIDVTGKKFSEDATLASQLKDAVNRASPKLALDARAAIPLSIAHIRPAFKGPGIRELDETLNQGLLQRLSDEPAFFILERHNMEMLSWEKDFASGPGTDFWTGKYVLSGTIEQDLVDTEKILVKMSLQGPNTSASEPPIIVPGLRSNLTGLIEATAKAVMSHFKQSSKSSWDPVKEGERFAISAEEAEKAGADWRFVESQAAAAWALGNRSDPAIRMRILSQLRRVCGFPYVGNPPDVSESTWPQVSSELKAHPELTSEKLDAALEALAVFRTYCSSIAKDHQNHLYGRQAIEIISQFLRLLFRETDWRDHAQAITAIQPSLREKPFWLDAANNWGNPERDYYELARDFAPYWYDSAQDVVSAYRQILLIPRNKWQPNYAKVFRSNAIEKLLLGDDEEVRTIAITKQNANAFAPLWKTLIQDLLSSQDVENQAAGFLAAVHDGVISPTPRELPRIVNILDSWDREKFSWQYEQQLLEIFRQIDPAQQRAYCKRAVLGVLSSTGAYEEPPFPWVPLEQVQESLSLEEAKEIYRPLLKHIEKWKPREEMTPSLVRKELESQFPALRALASEPKPGADTPLAPLPVRKWGDPNESYNFENLSHSGRVWLSARRRNAIVGLRPSDFNAIRIPLPPARNGADRVAYAGSRLVAISDSWLVMQVTQVSSPWRFLVYDFKTKSWGYVEKAPVCSEVALGGDALYGIYSDQALQQSTGLLRVNLTERTVEILSNSAGRGTIAATNAPKLTLSNLVVRSSGQILTQASAYSCWEFDPSKSAWRKTSMREWYEAFSSIERQPEALLSREKHNYSNLILHILDPEQNRFAAIPLKDLGMREISKPLSLPEGLFLSDEDTAAYISREEINDYIKRFRAAILKPIPLKRLPDQISLVGVLNEYGVRNLLVALPGSSPRVLAPHWWSSEGPELSPNGASILFRSKRISKLGNFAELFIATLDGSELRQLTFDRADPLGYSWSPDGSEIAFLAYGENQGYNLFLINSDGSNLRQLTNQAKSKIDLPFPGASGHASGRECGVAWSPDGKSLAFIDHPKNLVTIDREGSRIQKLAAIAFSQHPKFSPGGERIAFTTFFGGVFVVDSDGKNLKSLAPWAQTSDRQPDDPVLDHRVEWSPDGRFLLFDSKKDGKPVLCLADTQTGSVSTLVEGANINRIQWWPDGNGCYYEAVWKPKQHEESNQLFSMDFDSRKSVPLSEKSISLDDPNPTPKITEARFLKSH
jgi:Tol biopolymer transport system component